jgi:hypothetical protein
VLLSFVLAGPPHPEANPIPAHRFGA